MGIRKIGLGFFALILGYAAACLAATPQYENFSADMLLTSSGRNIQAKVYFNNGNVRTEMFQTISIIRRDQNVMWNIMPAQKMYMELQLNLDQLAQASPQTPGEVERVKVGDEMIDGRMTEKFKVTYDSNKGRQEMFQWIANSKLPVKMQAADESWTVEYKNIQTGPQDDALFLPPAGFQKMEMPALGGMNLQALQQMAQRVKDGEEKSQN